MNRSGAAVGVGAGLLAVAAALPLVMAARFGNVPPAVFLASWLAGAWVAGSVAATLSTRPVARLGPMLLVVLVLRWASDAGLGIGMETVATAVAGLAMFTTAGATLEPVAIRALRSPGRLRRTTAIGVAGTALALVGAAPSGAWVSGVRQATPSPAQQNTGGIDTARSTHQWLAAQGVTILGNDGHDAVAAFLASPDPTAPEATDPTTGAPLGAPNSYEWRLLGGVDDADGVLYPQIRDHLHNHWTHRGRRYVLGASAASNAEKAFAEAERRWAAGDKGDAVYWLGAALHLVQDACVPQHGWFGVGIYHSDYERWVRANQDGLAVTSGGMSLPWAGANIMQLAISNRHNN